MQPQLYQLRQQSSIIDKGSGDMMTQPNISNICDTESQESAFHEKGEKYNNFEDKINSTDDDPFLALQSDNETPHLSVKIPPLARYDSKKLKSCLSQPKVKDAPLLFSSLQRD